MCRQNVTYHHNNDLIFENGTTYKKWTSIRTHTLRNLEEKQVVTCDRFVNHVEKKSITWPTRKQHLTYLKHLKHCPKWLIRKHSVKDTYQDELSFEHGNTWNQNEYTPLQQKDEQVYKVNHLQTQFNRNYEHRLSFETWYRYKQWFKMNHHLKIDKCFKIIYVKTTFRRTSSKYK